MIYISGRTGDIKKVKDFDSLVVEMRRVQMEREYGAVFKIRQSDCAYLTYSTDLYTRDGCGYGFCLLWSDGCGYKALYPYAYKRAKDALNALLNC